MTSWLRFPVALRKMWPGGEVQAWLDEHAPAMTDTVPLPDLSDWHSPDRKSITAMLHSYAAARSAADNAALQQSCNQLRAMLSAAIGHAESARKRVEELEAASRWRPIETAPKDGRKMLLTYKNRDGKRRTVVGGWVTDEEAAETDTVGVGLEAGWYERIDNWDDFYQVAIHEGEPDYWMPLPSQPKEPK